MKNLRKRFKLSISACRITFFYLDIAIAKHIGIIKNKLILYDLQSRIEPLFINYLFYKRDNQITLYYIDDTIHSISSLKTTQHLHTKPIHSVTIYLFYDITQTSFLKVTIFNNSKL